MLTSIASRSSKATRSSRAAVTTGHVVTLSPAPAPRSCSHHDPDLPSLSLARRLGGAVDRARRSRARRYRRVTGGRPATGAPRCSGRVLARPPRPRRVLLRRRSPPPIGRRRAPIPAHHPPGRGPRPPSALASPPPLGALL